MRLLLVEDQKKLAGFIHRGLSELGYSVDLATTGEAAREQVSNAEYDLVVLDVMLPDANGLELAREIRLNGYAAPILMLTALSETKNKVEGLDAGADDYLTKPFEFEELAARIRALLRRGQAEANSILKFANVEMDLTKRKVSRGDRTLTLTTKEFALLEFFLRNPKRPLTRTSISEHVWDMHFDSDSNVIDVYVNMLRKKIDIPSESKLIHTLVGVGYVLEER